MKTEQGERTTPWGWISEFKQCKEDVPRDQNPRMAYWHCGLFTVWLKSCEI